MHMKLNIAGLAFVAGMAFKAGDYIFCGVSLVILLLFVVLDEKTRAL